MSGLINLAKAPNKEILRKIIREERQRSHIELFFPLATSGGGSVGTMSTGIYGSDVEDVFR
jgi:hypothetical protein